MISRAGRTVLYAAPVAILLSIACGGGRSSPGTTSEGGDSAATTTAATTGAPQIATVTAGQPLLVTRNVFGSKTVVEITVSDVKVGVKSGNQFIKPERGQFITAKVTVVAKEGKYAANPFNFKLVAPDGSVFDVAPSIAQPALGATELSPGQRTDGYITFDAAMGAEKGGKIALKDWLAEGDAGYWTIG